MQNFEEEKNIYINSFKMSPCNYNGNNTSNSIESKRVDSKNNRNSPSIELTHEIISKFDKLLNKEEYYHFQERVYKLNKTITSIAKSQNLNVSSFNSQLPSPNTPEKCKRLNSQLDISPIKLLQMLDELIKEKEDEEQLQLKTNDNIEKVAETEDNCNAICSFTGSSSEEDDSSNHSIHSKPFSKISQDNFIRKKKRLFKYLYNYELLYKASLLEKSLNRIEKDSMENSESSKNKTMELIDDKKICEEIGMNMILFSNLSKNMKISTNVSDSSTPNSNFKSLNDKRAKIENGVTTPSIKKFFFEDKEFHNGTFNKRRRSMMEEQKIIMEKNPEFNVIRRRSDFLLGLGQHGHIQSKFFSCNDIGNHDDSFVSKFDTNNCIEGDSYSSEELNTTIKSNIVSSSFQNNSLQNFQKRSSLLDNKYDKDYNHLNNINENEEFNNSN